MIAPLRPGLSAQGGTPIHRDRTAALAAMAEQRHGAVHRDAVRSGTARFITVDGKPVTMR